MSFELHHGDCLDVMATLPDASIDCVLTDPPYGTTACKWDSVIPFEPMWKELKRIVKPKAAICLFGSQPFTSALVMSNPKMFRYEWIWEKAVGSNFATTKYMPMKEHENILVFGIDVLSYYPQLQARKGSGLQRIGTPYYSNSLKGGDYLNNMSRNNAGGIYGALRVPSSVQFFNNREKDSRGEHPTQKPVELLRYLVRTYTLEGQTVLDFTMGSGTTGVACELENRNFIGIEKDAGYFEIATKRIEGVKKNEPLFAKAA